PFELRDYQELIRRYSNVDEVISFTRRFFHGTEPLVIKISKIIAARSERLGRLLTTNEADQMMVQLVGLHHAQIEEVYRREVEAVYWYVVDNSTTNQVHAPRILNKVLTPARLGTLLRVRSTLKYNELAGNFRNLIMSDSRRANYVPPTTDRGSRGKEPTPSRG